MPRIIVLDSNTLGIACGNRGKAEVEEFTIWSIHVRSNGSVLVIPEVADYEVRRGLMLDQLNGGRPKGIKRLDDLRRSMAFLPITREAMTRAAELWADVRHHGLATGGQESLDGDAIIAAQGLCHAGLADSLIVATTNIRRLSRYVTARDWREIEP